MTDNRSDKPNILVIQCDSMDGRVMGCMGHPAAHTPNIDALARRGVLFSDAYCNSPLCVPSRASMWSGRFAFRLGSWNLYEGLERDARTFETRLAEDGYLVNTVGKTDYLSGSHTVWSRVEAWTGPAGIQDASGHLARPDAKIVEHPHQSTHDRQTIQACLEWLDANGRDRSRPFVLYCGLTMPHRPYRTTQEWLDKIDPSKVAMPARDETPHSPLAYSRARRNSDGEFERDEILGIRRTYYAMIAEMDALVGQLLDKVSALALDESTYVVFLSDHGDMQMEHGLHLKDVLYEPAVRIPLIIAGPGVSQGVVVAEPISLVDLYPTLTDMAGIQPQDSLDGSSLWPELHGRSNPGRPPWVFSEYHGNFQRTSSFMLRRGPWKYVTYMGSDPQLFDLSSDPDEVRNLALAQPDVVREMDYALRDIVDPEAIANEVRSYNRESYRRWHAETPPHEVERIMAEVYARWGAGHRQRIAEWLDEG